MFLAAVAAATPACAVDPGGGGGHGDDPVCGDSVCEVGETAKSCAADCDMSGPTCGDDVCDADETAKSCPADCGQEGPTCGNGACETGETQQSCAADCGSAPACNNNVCEGNETTTCPNDCPATLRVANSSAYSIWGLYLAPCGGSWTDDLLTGSNYIPSNYVVTVNNVPPGCWWFHATTASGDRYWETPSPVTLNPSATFTWTLY